MTKEESLENKKLFGLLGKNISYSFSSGYFKEKFIDLALDTYQYSNFDIPQIADFTDVISANKNSLQGLNVTIPYKETIMPFLDKLDPIAKQIGAVNTIKITKKGNLKGYNTDAFGFENSLKPFLLETHKKALILGTGGASKAIAYVLNKLKIDFLYVSRNPKNSHEISYESIDEQRIENHQLIINCTPLGTFPETDKHPNIPYQFLTENHLLYDLIYNPSETTFLSKGKEKGSKIKNGLEMLQLQAEKSWEIWNR